MSKGSNRRPAQIDQGQYDNNWANVFGNRQVEEDFVEEAQCSQCRSFDIHEVSHFHLNMGSTSHAGYYCSGCGETSSYYETSTELER